MSVQAYIADRSSPEPNTGCWLWDGSVNRFGYGKASRRNRTVGAHRLSYEVHKGRIPEGLQVLHKCHVRCCVNPDHLYAGTAQDNMDDKMRRGRHRVPCGSDQPAAKLTDDQVRAIFADPRPNSAIARTFGVSRPAVSLIKNGHTWRHLGLSGA